MIAALRALPNTGRINAASIPMMAITVSNSMSVNALAKDDESLVSTSWGGGLILTRSDGGPDLFIAARGMLRQVKAQRW
jgi:hypothetical protein